MIGLWRKTLLVNLLLVGILAVGAMAQEDWPSFRGKGGMGVVEGFATVDRWDVATGENILWRTEIPGLAHSSVVVWGDRIFATTVVYSRGAQSLRVGLYGSGNAAQVEGDFWWQVNYHV